VDIDEPASVQITFLYWLELFALISNLIAYSTSNVEIILRFGMIKTPNCFYAAKTIALNISYSHKIACQLLMKLLCILQPLVFLETSLNCHEYLSLTHLWCFASNLT
jgi:hypothetical protein